MMYLFMTKNKNERNDKERNTFIYNFSFSLLLLLLFFLCARLCSQILRDSIKLIYQIKHDFYEFKVKNNNFLEFNRNK